MDIRSKLKDKELEQIERFIRETPLEVDLVNRTMNKYESERNTNQLGGFSTHMKMRHKVVIMIASAAVIFILVFVTSFISPTMAAALKQVPGASSIFKLAGDLGLKTADERGLTIKPHTSVTQNNFTLNISEVVYDGTRVSIGIERLYTESEFSEEVLGDRISNIKLFINNKPIQSFAPDHTIPIFQHPGKDKDSVILEFMDLSNQGGSPFPEAFNLTLLTTVNGIEEPLEMTIPVKKIEDFLILEPNESRDFGHVRFTVKKIHLTPITTNITTQKVMIDNSKFALSPIAMDMGVDLFDDQGNKIKLINGNGFHAADGNNQIMDLRYSPLEAGTKTISLKPYIRLFEDKQKGVYQFDENNEPMVEYIPELEITLSINTQK